MKLTRELIYSLQTPRGSWNRHQLELMGVPWPPQGGWMGRIIGKEVSDATVDEIKRLATVSAKVRRQEKKNRTPQLPISEPKRIYIPCKEERMRELLYMLMEDYDHPWPDEDSDTKEHRERRLSQMREVLKQTTD